MKLVKTAVAAALMFSAASSAMDARYQDRSGNLVADLPQNEAEWVNPGTLSLLTRR
ncbi:hypothetical protein JCM19231_2720 [Vibrio ishigakensis]|uniref:Uncharacterized protein n=1 Tax=Vibrio ishigakensis TaxID=1481914 RepID=A0A0B8NUR5_9VIBR|nr:hypothetical protein JCM19231_2720 [Vibrio ishigakensis]GAM73695.1 hypothetical protein JCM19241_3150 [Vibrio ishigakensis]